MAGNNKKEDKNSALQERVAALLQPMPGHETTLVDFEKQTHLTKPSGKVLLGIVAAVVLLVALGSVVLGEGEQTSAPPPTQTPIPGIIAAAGKSETGAGGSSGAPRRTAESSETPDTTPTSAGESEEKSTGPVVVSVQGKVRHPGLKTLDSGKRVGDAITQAGGALPGANLQRVNLAEKVSDGIQIVVDEHGSFVLLPGESGGQGGQQEGEAASGTGAGTGASGAGASGPGKGGAQGGKVNINTAGADELETLDGVGPATAKAIIQHRETNGPFGAIEQVMEVRGIGPAKFEAMKGGITL